MSDPIGDNLGYWCHDAAHAHPDKVAIIDLSGEDGRCLTYRDLEGRLDRVAAWTREVGLVPGDRMELLLGNREEFIVAMFGAMRAGVVPVATGTRLGTETIDYILRDADCRAAVVDSDANAHAVAAVEGAGVAPRLLIGAARDGWGGFHYHDRVDDMFSSGGEIVCSKEVENTFTAHPKDDYAGVAQNPDPVTGEVPAAMATLAPGETMAEAELKRPALDRGPARADPRHVVFGDRMPLNSAARVDRTAIRADLAPRFESVIAARRDEKV